jgi:hypothetical protein
MNKKLKLGVILFSIGIVLYLGYLIFVGIALSNSLWTDNFISVFISIYLGLFLIVPLVILFTIGFVQIKKSAKISILNLSLLTIAVVVIPLASLATFRLIDRHNYNVTYTFTPTKWEEADMTDRARLIDSFRQQYDLVGKNINAVSDLLGEPDSQEELQYIYNIGDYKKWLSIDSYYYVIAYGLDNIITGEDIFQS